MPQGKVKFDETFQKDVETYRNELRVRVPVEKAPARFALHVVSQGCADAGLCYPPMTSAAQISLTAFGGDGSARVTAANVDASPAAGVALSAGGAGAPGTVTPLGRAAAPRRGSTAARSTACCRAGASGSSSAAFFAMGVALSFTPCVLPMLPILSSIIVGAGGAGVARQGLEAGRPAIRWAWRWSTPASASPRAWPAKAWPRGCKRRRCWRCSRAMLALFALSMFDVYELRLPSSWSTRMSERVAAPAVPGRWPACSAWARCRR